MAAKKEVKGRMLHGVWYEAQKMPGQRNMMCVPSPIWSSELKDDQVTIQLMNFTAQPPSPEIDDGYVHTQTFDIREFVAAMVPGVKDQLEGLVDDVLAGDEKANMEFNVHLNSLDVMAYYRNRKLVSVVGTDVTEGKRGPYSFNGGYGLADRQPSGFSF